MIYPYDLSLISYILLLEVGTWKYDRNLMGTSWLHITYNNNNRTRYYENVPGSTAWIRRPDTDELGWGVVMVPTIAQYSGDMRPFQVV